MAIPVEAPVSTSLTLFGPLPLPTSDDTSVPTAPLGIGVSDTSSRKTDLLLLRSVSVNASVEFAVPAVTRSVSSCQPMVLRGLVERLVESFPLVQAAVMLLLDELL